MKRGNGALWRAIPTACGYYHARIKWLDHVRRYVGMTTLNRVLIVRLVKSICVKGKDLIELSSVSRLINEAGKVKLGGVRED